jgi:hypothetical protein
MKNSATFIVSALFAMAVATSSASAQELPYQPVTSLSAIPPEVFSALTKLCNGCKFADFNAPWNLTDVINGLPRRRLVKAGHRGSQWIIQYEHGGFAPHPQTVVFELNPKIHLAKGSSCLPQDSQRCEW